MNILKLAESINLLNQALEKEVTRRELEVENVAVKTADFLQKIDDVLDKVILKIRTYAATKAEKRQVAAAAALIDAYKAQALVKPQPDFQAKAEIKADIAEAKDEVQQ